MHGLVKDSGSGVCTLPVRLFICVCVLSRWFDCFVGWVVA